MHILKEPVVLAQRRAREKQEQAPVRRKSQVDITISLRYFAVKPAAK